MNTTDRDGVRPELVMHLRRPSMDRVLRVARWRAAPERRG